MLTFTFIVCTYNRVPFIQETIESILLHCAAHSNYELLVIDNNSTDGTAEAVKPFLQNPVVRYVLETEQGLSHARNRGIKEAKNDVLIFVDDDIDLDARYLDVCENLFANPDLNIVGGKVLAYNAAVPDWLPKKYYYLASMFDLGDEAQPTEKLMGANYALRKTVAERIGWYNPELGRKGNNLMAGEENDYFNRARALGYSIWYEPKLVVYHKIANKLNLEYIYTYAQLSGRSEGLIDGKAAPARFGAKAVKSLIMLAAFNLYGAHTRAPQKRTYFKINQLAALGYLSVVREKYFGQSRAAA
ncbi:glycosyltransferase [Hymenobacter sp. BT770]|uniref:glycosyltransferase family 2 protein n=1 Tax=Hymenobacter sp. BT770 TaxID=2886942 RepID=UPI001D1011B4|nr:glycosyltransferase [Hymenobacter sp. BT770]MCC3152804.1 glycosyltransferase family 2 protein [Hymenobacter sp. BT770]MDO3414879.1 glycosyltransferase [Hymenobacter sp. BT770]